MHSLRSAAASLLLVLTSCAVLTSCGAAAEDEPDDGAARTPLTQRQRDSAIGASRLPGAQGVRGALRSADAGAARAAALDSLQRAP